METKQLLHVGFNARQAILLAEGGAPTFAEYVRAGFSPRQTRTLLREDLTLDVLIHGGFTRAQAELIIAG